MVTPVKVWVESWDSLSVDVEEHDEWSENDSTTVSLSPSQWYVDTASIYTLKVAAEYDEEVARSVCIGGEVGAEYSGASASASIESCSEWTDAADNYVFHLKIYD